MKLVTIRQNWETMTPEYVPGKCNIGRRGRAMRLSTGAALIALSVIPGLSVFSQANPLLKLLLGLPIYVGLLTALEGSTSFCVLHARRGTFDFHEPRGFASSRSKTLNEVVSEEWKRIDRRKAVRMHVEAVAGAIVLSILLALA
jgi:hypothetical protein